MRCPRTRLREASGCGGSTPPPGDWAHAGQDCSLCVLVHTARAAKLSVQLALQVTFPSSPPPSPWPTHSAKRHLENTIAKVLVLSRKRQRQPTWVCSVRLISSGLWENVPGKVHMTPRPSEFCQPDPHTQHGRSPASHSRLTGSGEQGRGLGWSARSSPTTPARPPGMLGHTEHPTVTCTTLRGRGQNQPLRTAMPPTPPTPFVLFRGSGNTWFTFHVKHNRKARLR